MHPEEIAPSPERPVVAALPRAVRLDAVRPPATRSPAEAPLNVVPVSAASPDGPLPESGGPTSPPPEVAAPRRAVRLVAKTPVSEESKLAARQ